MRKLFLLAIIISGSFAYAQPDLSYSEFGLGIGSLNYSGDIGTDPNSANLIKEVQPEFFVFAKRHTNDWFSFGLAASFGWIQASDINHNNPGRGLEVKTSLLQVNPFMEFDFLKFGKFHYERKVGIFGRIGLGFLAYNPEISSTEVYPTEIDPKVASYTTYNYFFGGGLKFRLGYKTIMTLESEIHYAGTDQLDGILHKNPAEQGDSDVYGGLRVTFSKMLF